MKFFKSSLEYLNILNIHYVYKVSYIIEINEDLL